VCRIGAAPRVASVTLLTAAVLARSSPVMLETVRERNRRSIIKMARNVRWCYGWPAMSNGVVAGAEDPGVSFRACHPERTFRAVVGIEVVMCPTQPGTPRVLLPTKAEAVPRRAMTAAPFFA